MVLIKAEESSLFQQAVKSYGNHEDLERQINNRSHLKAYSRNERTDTEQGSEVGIDNKNEQPLPTSQSVPARVNVDSSYPVQVPRSFPVTVERLVPYIEYRNVPVPVHIPIARSNLSSSYSVQQNLSSTSSKTSRSTSP